MVVFRYRFQGRKVDFPRLKQRVGVFFAPMKKGIEMERKRVFVEMFNHFFHHINASLGGRINLIIKQSTHHQLPKVLILQNVEPFTLLYNHKRMLQKNGNKMAEKSERHGTKRLIFDGKNHFGEGNKIFFERINQCKFLFFQKVLLFKKGLDS